jgi:4-hydroxybenzoate polyprenyltransferase
VHPFPSALNAGVTAVIVLVAGGAASRAALLGGSMLLLQFAVGAVNDWADAVVDAGRPGKPITAGVVGRGEALAIGVVSALAGIVLAGVAGPVVVAIGAAGLAAGLAYDLGLKGTAGAWLCFAAGFVLLPAFGWHGAVGVLPPFLPWILLLALPAGAVVSLANGLVDLERDRATGRRTPAVLLGPQTTIRGVLALDAVIAIGAVASLAGASSAPEVRAVVWAGVVGGAGLQLAGAWVGRRPDRDARLAGWRLQALGLAVLAAAWFAGMAT